MMKYIQNQLQSSVLVIFSKMSLIESMFDKVEPDIGLKSLEKILSFSQPAYS